MIPSTELFRDVTQMFKNMTQVDPRTLPDAKTIPQGAATTLYCSVHPDVLEKAGEYFSDCGLAKDVTSDAKNEEYAAKLWDLSEKLVAKFFNH